MLLTLIIRPFGISDRYLRGGRDKWLIGLILLSCTLHLGNIFLGLHGEWILWCVAFWIHEHCSIAGVVVCLADAGLRIVPLIGSFGGSNDWRCVFNAKWFSKGFVTISWQHLEHEWAECLAVCDRWAWSLWVGSYRHIVEHVILGLWGSNLHDFYYHLRAFLLDFLLDDLAGIRKVKLGFRVVAVTVLIAHRLITPLLAFLLFLD